MSNYRLHWSSQWSRTTRGVGVVPSIPVVVVAARTIRIAPGPAARGGNARAGRLPYGEGLMLNSMTSGTVA